ncbi:MAG TPA: AGE family epimerase/isomerase [Candidatus Methylomirabilis sp.]|nr:AGE family epimerase/isomerase [Candidatus Methylomirabilis sp.]
MRGILGIAARRFHRSVPLPDLIERLSAHARSLRAELVAKVLPYWFDTAQDPRHGGFLLADDLGGRRVATDKQIVSQARMVWGFSHAHRKGFSDARRSYLTAATRGYHFLLDRFLDRDRAGYVWKTDRAGRVLDDRKFIYAQAFAIFALVEYHRASGDRAAIDSAMDLYRALHTHCRDAVHGGWVEHFTRDWQPILDPSTGREVEVPGLKSGNTHVHVMEALTELYEVTRDPGVEAALEEALQINARHFHPPEAALSRLHRHADWSEVGGRERGVLSYGHNVEFAWLMIRAERILGRAPSWDHFHGHLEHALRRGFDHRRGGLYARGVGDRPADQTDKIWWVQAEMLAALSEGLAHRPDRAYAEALDKLIRFVRRYQADPIDGIWLDTVTAAGRPKATGKAHNWKANYHDLRAVVKFIELFHPPSGGRGSLAS